MINGLDGQRMLIALLIGIAILIILVLKTKVQAFLALIVTTVIVGIIGGMPLATEMIKVDGIEKPFGIVNSITTGFGGTLGNIGIIIGFGVMMGEIFEVSGAAKRMAYSFLRLFGKGREEEALALTGFFVSIPIFCDSGFIVLAPIAKALSESTKKSVIGLGVALASGLVITHSLVPPTPGPLGVAGIFGIDVGKFILMTLVLAVPMTFACIAYSRKVLSKKFYRLVKEDGVIEKAEYQEPDYEAAFNMDMSGVPGTFESFAPLLLPISAHTYQYSCNCYGQDRWHNEGSYLPWTANRCGWAWTNRCYIYARQTFQQRGASSCYGERYGKRWYYHAGNWRWWCTRSDY